MVNTRGRLIVKAQTDIIPHPYIMTLDLLKLKTPGGKKKRRIRGVNTYDNNLMADQV